jgi:hypothetical protein
MWLQTERISHIDDVKVQHVGMAGTLKMSVLKIPGSNLSRGTGYPDWFFVVFLGLFS